MKIVTARDKQLHIGQYGDTLCGKKELPVKDVLVQDLLPNGKRSGHSYGDELIRSAVCKTCKTKARDHIRHRAMWWQSAERTELFRDIFRTFRGARPLPQQANRAGVNRLMSNVRERSRRKSKEAQARGRLWIVRTTNSRSNSSTVETWDHKYHAAFMLGVNYAIREIFEEFKLEKYDKFKEQAFAEIHELITGEELPDPHNTEED